MTTNNSVNTPLSGTTGTGHFVGDNSPTLITPALGTPASGTLTNCTGLPAAGVIGTAATKIVSGHFTFNLTTATGGTSVVNTLTFTPKGVFFMCSINASTTVSIGFDDGTSPQVVYNDAVDAATTWGFLTTFSIVAAAQTGANQTAKITTLASNGFTITWTKTGSPTGTVTVMWTAIG